MLAPCLLYRTVMQDTLVKHSSVGSKEKLSNRSLRSVNQWLDEAAGDTKQNRNIVRSLLIVGYIVAVLLISGLARAEEIRPSNLVLTETGIVPLN